MPRMLAKRRVMTGILALCEADCSGWEDVPWITDWGRSLLICAERAIVSGKPTTTTTTRVVDNIFGRVQRALTAAEVGPSDFAFLVRLLSEHFVRVYPGENTIQTVAFFKCAAWNPFSEYLRQLRVLASR